MTDFYKPYVRTQGLSIAGGGATGFAIAVAAGETVTTGLSMTCSGTGTITTAISLSYTASATECLAATVATGKTITRGMSFSGAGTYTTGILLDATAITTGISISAGSMTDAIKISGTTPVDGIEISSACSAVGLNISGACASGISIAACTATNIAISGTNVLGIALTGTYSTAGIQIGTSGSPVSMAAAADMGIAVYTTSPSVDAGVSVQPIYSKCVMAGIGGVGGRACFHMTTNVALGGWSNALKGIVEYGTAGRTTGLGSAICAEMTMSAGTSSGTYAPIEIELNMGASGVTGTATSLVHMSVNDAAATTFDTSGYIMSIQGLTVNSGKAFQVNTAEAATHALRILVGSTPYYMMLTSAGA